MVAGMVQGSWSAIVLMVPRRILPHRDIAVHAGASARA